ncbi:MAG: dTDP-4-dehydrorhamnose reductase [Patescibacteria group bacterium]
MKVLIVGARGMLGQELAAAFGTWEPVLWDREQCDITNRSTVERMVGELKPDMVLNAAAYNDVDGAEQNGALAQQLNAEAPGYLAAAVRASGGILVHYSTDYVFRGDEQRGYSEEAQPDPQSIYAHSKFAGEQAVQNSGAQYYLIRLSRLFGRPAASATGKKSFVDTMLQLATTRESVDAVDEELSCPTYAPDLARQTKFIVEQKMPFSTYHVTNSGACTWYGLAKEIFSQCGVRATLNPVPAGKFPRPAARPRYSALLNTKLPPLRPWQDALAEYLVQEK